MPATVWMAQEAGGALSSWCSSAALTGGLRQQRPCQVCGPGWLAREEKSPGVFVFSLCSSAALAVERGSRGHASCVDLDGLQGRRRAEVSLSSLCAQGCCSLCGLRQPRPCQLLLLCGLRGRRRAEVSLSILCVQVLLSVWTEAAEVMLAVVAGWLDGLQEEKSRGVFVFSLCSRAALIGGVRQPRPCQLLLLDGL